MRSYTCLLTIICSLGIITGVTAFAITPEDALWSDDFSAQGFDGGINALLVFQGKLVAGGSFEFIGKTRVNHIAIWDGFTWDALGAGFDGEVFALTEWNGQLVAGGNFTQSGDQIVSNVAIWTGIDWYAPGGGVSDAGVPAVRAVMEFNGDLIVGGTFRKAGSLNASRVARWDGASWSAMALNVVGAVYALGEYDGELVAGGSFNSIDGVPILDVAGWDGTGWHKLGGGLSGSSEVAAMVEFNGQLIVGGLISSLTGGISVRNLAAWDGTQWSAVPFIPSTSRIKAFLHHNNQLIVGTGDENRTNRIFTFDGAQWAAIGVLEGCNSTVQALTEIDGVLVEGGASGGIDGVIAPNIACWNGVEWSDCFGGSGGQGIVRNGQDAIVLDLLEYNGELVTGGRFCRTGEIGESNVASWNGQSWAPMGSGLPYGVMNLTLHDGLLIAAGDHDISIWDGFSWAKFGTTNGFVRTVVEYEGNLIIGGSFSRLDNVPINHLAMWDGLGWNGFGLSEGMSVTGLGIYGDSLIVAGNGWISAWSNNSWAPMGSMYGWVNTTTSFRGFLIVGGTFNRIGSTSVNNVASWTGASWESLGPGLDGVVAQFLVHNDLLYAVGSFSLGGGVAVWDGLAWHPLGTGCDSKATCIESYEGALFVGGTFSSAGGKASSRIAKWESVLPLEVEVDLLPGECPNTVAELFPVDVSRPRTATVGNPIPSVEFAILGMSKVSTDMFEPSTFSLESAKAVGFSMSDVSSPYTIRESACDCFAGAPDGYTDITINIDRSELFSGFGPYQDGEMRTLVVAGTTKNGLPVRAHDCARLKKLAVDVPTPNPGSPDSKKHFLLHPNYPNPFNSSTVVSFEVNSRELATVNIYDVLGRRVVTLLDGMVEAGHHQIGWDGSSDIGTTVSSGIYFCRVQVGGETATQKMLLLK